MLTNKDKKRMQRMVAQRNERLKGGRFWDIMEAGLLHPGRHL